LREKNNLLVVRVSNPQFEKHVWIVARDIGDEESRRRNLIPYLFSLVLA
jgi:hypothetical protein